MNYKSKEEIELLWRHFEDVLFLEDDDGELILAENFHLFDKGTPRNSIWQWFDEHYEKGVACLLGLSDCCQSSLTSNLNPVP
ncbi:MAG: hypothetical protein K8S16_01545 [Bacteroidales bacterium]|nr:hypothetical protein [Bacteroidales bacterium]